VSKRDDHKGALEPMQVTLQKQARATPAIRQELRESTLPTKTLARMYNLHRNTVRKLRNRDSNEDRSHRPHRLQSNLSEAQEAIVMPLRKALLLPPDDLLAVTHEFISTEISRSGLARCVRRHGVSNLNALIPHELEAKPTKSFKHYEPGYVHVDLKYLPQMPNADSRYYLLAAIEYQQHPQLFRGRPCDLSGRNTLPIAMTDHCNKRPTGISIPATGAGGEESPATRHRVCKG